MIFLKCSYFPNFPSICITSRSQKWSDIQLSMKVSANVGDTSVLGKMRRIQRQEISSDRREKALLILHRYKEEQVRKVNSDAHSYYLWVSVDYMVCGNANNARNVLNFQ